MRGSESQDWEFPGGSVALVPSLTWTLPHAAGKAKRKKKKKKIKSGLKVQLKLRPGFSKVQVCSLSILAVT